MKDEVWGSQSLTELHGVGPERSAQLARLGLHTVRDLLRHRPRRYEDRRHVQPIAQLALHEFATARGQIVALGVKTFAQGRKSVFEIILDDGSARLHCRWWNLPYMQNYFKQGDEVLLHGKTISLKPRTIDHPETEVVEAGAEESIHLDRIAPIYPLTEGLPQRWLRSLIWRTLEQFGRDLPDSLPPELRSDLPSLAEAIQSLHFPGTVDQAGLARQRLALEELVAFQMSIQARRRTLLAKAEGRPCPGTYKLIKPFLAQLGFSLTAGQIKVLRELRHDMSQGRPMRRLLQGDVGSGKTVVAACSALLAMESGFSVALMAPTEILAQQHYQTFTRWFQPLGLPVHLQTGSHKTMPDPREESRTRDAEWLPLKAEAGSNPVGAGGPPALVIGTHALIESSFSIDQLGLVIIDEQHRFGVTQREKLVRKGAYPHLLLMTATPIPRTLGLTLYGDLEISTIDELPQGRTPIRTYLRTAESLPKVWSFVQTKLAEGRQAFIVFPRVEDTAQGLKAVKAEFEVLRSQLQPHAVGLLHGRLDAEEKELVMGAFRRHELAVLLSTSLIEVGIDVPNATLMVVENAEQFGLAQLHQLRGRIGRGAHESHCILILRSKSPEAEQRLKILAETSDGFRIAEADLSLRGPGDLLGQEQSGLPPFQFADLVKDLPLIERARAIAAKLPL